MNRDSLKEKTVSGMAWSGSAKALSQAANFVVGIILARLLTPNDFGLVAMVLVFSNFGQLFLDFGLTSALIQRSDLKNEHYSTSFWFSALIGACLSVAMFLASGSIADFYSASEVEGICSVLSITFLLNALGSAPKAILSKNLHFKSIALIDLLSTFFAGGVAIWIAMRTNSYWAIVVQAVLFSLLQMIAFHRAAPMPVRLVFRMWALRDLLAFSTFVFLTKILRQTAVQADKLLIGKFLDVQTLGLYSRAYQITLFPLNNVSRVVGGVLFPALTLIKSDPARIRAIYLRSINAISLLTFPMMLGLYVVAPYFVESVLGEQWLGLVPMLQVFCVVGLFTSITTITGSIYLALGEAKLQLRVNLINQPMQVVFLCIGVSYGLKGVLIAYVISNALAIIHTLSVAGRLIGLTVVNILRSVLANLACAMLMAITITYIDGFFVDMSVLLRLVSLVAIGCLAYLATLLVVQPQGFTDIRQLLLEKMVQRKSGSNL